VITVIIVTMLARVGKTVPTTNLLLAGVAVSSFASALTSGLMIHSTGEVRRALVWLMGGSMMTGWQPLLGVLPYMAVGLAGLVLIGHPLNVLQFGEEQAQQLGIRVQRVRWFTILLATLATAAAVASPESLALSVWLCRTLSVWCGEGITAGSSPFRCWAAQACCC